MDTLDFMKNSNFLNEPTLRPAIPHHTKIFYKSIKGAKDFYKYAQCSLKNEHSMKEKWNHDFNSVIDDQSWNRIFKVCHHTTPDNVLISFQLRIIYRILGTKYYLKKVGISDSDNCQRCHIFPETLLHMFVDCSYVQRFWNNLAKYISDKANYNIKFTDFTIIFGSLINDQNSEPFNNLLLISKKYIFNTAKANSPLSLHGLQHKLSQSFEELQYLARVSNSVEAFNKNWLRWQPVYTSFS